MARPREFDRSEALDRAMLVFCRGGTRRRILDDLTRAMGINRPSLYNDRSAISTRSIGRR